MTALGMGSHLRGSAPPFTPAGLATMGRGSISDRQGVFLPLCSTFQGILLRWRTDGDYARSLLPAPLEPTADSDCPTMLIGERQLHLPADSGQEDPSITNWHELQISIPCSINDRKGAFAWITYRQPEIDSAVLAGIYRGFWTKLARFSSTLPLAAQPVNREMAPGHVARVVMSRFDRRVVGATFRAERELDEGEIPGVLEIPGLQRRFGLRFMADYATPGGPPLVQDLVSWDAVGLSISRAWTGRATVVFEAAEEEELEHLAPLEYLDSLYVHGTHQDLAGRVEHSYLDR
jgi:hypothetical protein